MRRTVNIKLSLENRRYLEKTIQQFKKACQMTVEEGWIEEGLKTYSKFNLQERIYGEPERRPTYRPTLSLELSQEEHKRSKDA